MNWKFTTEPTFEPVTLAEAKEHLRVLHSDDDTYITVLITVARETLEAKLWRPICLRTVKLYMKVFERREIELPQAANVTLVSVKYKDTASVEQTLSDVQIDDVAEPARIYPPIALNSWPTTNGIINNIVVEYTAGYSAGNMPKSIKQACLLIIGHLYQNREEVVVGRIASEIPKAADFLTSNYSLKRYL